ncbi:MAG: hypothetical protein AAF449_14300 [Myxococcota bacterium]
MSAAVKTPTAKSRGFWLVGAMFALFGAETAQAQVSGDQLNQAFDAQRAQQLNRNSFDAVTTFGRLDEDFFLNLNLRLSFDREYWGIGIQAPLRLRIIDNDPQDNDDIGSIIRKEDWDQPSDYLRLLRYIYIGKADKKGPFYVRFGELSGLSIGHGTIMHRYYNNFDISRWRAGLNAAVNIGAFGAEVMVGDIVDFHVAGARFTVRPLQLALGEGLWDRFVVGASVIADRKAPFALQTEPDENGNPVVQVNDEDEPIVAEEQGVVVVGLDIGFELLTSDILSITPYMDFNRITTAQNGFGWHAGILWNVRVPMLIDTFIADLRTEYRRVSGDYVAPYFNTVYEIERYNVLGNDQPLPIPKAQCLETTTAGCTINTGQAKNGYLFEALFGLPNFVYLSGEFLDYDGDQPDGQLRLSLEIPALEIIQFSAFYYRVNIDGASDMFALDDKSAVIAQVTVPVYGIVSAQARWWRVWRADPDEGGYASVDDWSVGFGISYSF